MTQPLVTIFLPYYNDEAFLTQAIQSVLSQSYENFELILFNHASTDGSREISRSFDDARIIHIDAKENLLAGSGFNWKTMLQVAKGSYLKTFCADDILTQHCLKELVNYIDHNSDIDIVFSNMDYIDNKGQFLNTDWAHEHDSFNFDNDEIDTLKLFFHGHGHLPYPSAMIRTDLLRKTTFDYTLIMQFDMSLWVNLIINGAKLKILNKKLVYYRIHPAQLSTYENEKLNLAASYFESMRYISYFFKIKDIAVIKKICETSRYLNKITSDDILFSEFIIAHELLCLKLTSPYKQYAYMKMIELLQNDELREKIQKRFHFGIKEFRMLYFYVPTTEKSTKNSTKIKLKYYNKPVKDLNLFDLLFLFLRQIFNILTLKKFKKSPEKERYTT